MKKILLAAVALMITLSSFARDINKNIRVANFNGLDISSVFDVTVTKSRTTNVDITIDEEYEKYLVVKVKGTTLYLGLDTDKMPKSLRNNMSDRALQAHISMPSLELLKASGATKFSTEDTFEVIDFKAVLSGASHIRNLTLSGIEAEFEISGACKANIYGNLKEASYDISGASNIWVVQNIEDADFEISGASNLKAKGDYTELEISCSGASKATFEGNARKGSIDCSGASKVDAENLHINSVEVEASGASNIEVAVGSYIEVELSGSSSVYYYAPESVRVEVKSMSRACSLKRR